MVGTCFPSQIPIQWSLKFYINHISVCLLAEVLGGNMSLSAVQKKEIMTEHGQNAKDTGSPEVQVALWTHRIKHLTEHLKANKKDNHSRRGLLTLVNKRRSLLDYLKAKDLKRYQDLIEKLELRR